ncbi:unnamed protein product, partial [Dovyalis caffra]
FNPSIPHHLTISHSFGDHPRTVLCSIQPTNRADGLAASSNEYPSIVERVQKPIIRNVTQPLTTIIGTNATGRRFWVSAMMKDNEKKNILAVQTLRNLIMGSTLMATTSILLSAGLAAIISSTYSVKKPLNDAVYGGHGEFMVALKYVTILTIFLFSFFCHSLSIRFVNQVNLLINTPQNPMSVVTSEYVSELLEKGFILNTVGNRLFYSAMPLLLWIFGPVLVFLCSVTMVPVLYNLDFVFGNGKGKMDRNGDLERDFVSVKVEDDSKSPTLINLLHEAEGITLRSGSKFDCPIHQCRLSQSLPLSDHFRFTSSARPNLELYYYTSNMNLKIFWYFTVGRIRLIRAGIVIYRVKYWGV